VQPTRPGGAVGAAGLGGTVRWDARIAAGAVPFAVLASVHLLVLLLLRLLAWTPTQDTAVSTPVPDELTPTDLRPAAVLTQADHHPAVAPMQDTESGQDAQQARRVWGRALLASETQDKPVSWQDVQAATGLSRSRSYALLRQERETLAGTNGQGRTLLP